MIICEYIDWYIEELDNNIILHNLEDSEAWFVKEVYHIEFSSELENMSQEELDALCPCDFDYCGELFDGTVYAFWTVLERCM